MNEQELKAIFAQSGDELAGLVMGRFVGKIADELSNVVSRAQRAQAEAEQATEAANQQRGELEKKIITLRSELTGLSEQLRDRRAEVEKLQAEHDELAPVVADLRSEAKRYAGQVANIIGGAE